MSAEKKDITDKINKAAGVISSGGVALFPTDTVCGLFASPGQTEAVKKIYIIKKRDFSKPLAMLVPDIESVWEIAPRDKVVEKKIKNSWPGAVTFILDTGDGKTMAFRMPDFKPLLKLLALTGPLYATSANFSGQKAPVTVDDVYGAIKEKCDIVVSLPVSSSGSPSKIIDLSGEKKKILRR